MAQTFPKNFILICGDEEYRKEQRKDELLKALGCEGSLNYNVFSDENLDPDEIRSLIHTMPFLEPQRKLLIMNSGWFKGTVSEEIRDIFSDIPDTTVVLFCEKDTDKSNALYKLAAKDGEVFHFEAAESRSGREKAAGKTEVRNWIRDTLKANGRRIDSRTAFELAELTGYDMQNLSTELEKLICYTYGRPEGAVISRADIDAVCSKTLTDRIFDMIDCRLAGKTAEALRILEELYALKISAMRILYVMGRQYNQALAYTECRQQRLSDAETAGVLGTGTWLVEKLKARLASVSPLELEAALDACADMEYRVKTGDMPEKLALELLLIG